jgi:methionyl-tRNA formyltransferase
MGTGSFRVVVLTNGNPHALHILQKLQQRQVVVDAVVCETATFRSARKRTKNLSAFCTEVPRATARWGRSKLRAFQAKRTYAAYTSIIVRTGALNGEAMRRDLASLKPHLLVLGGIGILKEQIIAIPTHGVLNGHPGLLPWLRGTGVVAGSIQRGVAVGATCHYVNPGVDRGDVIDRRLLPLDGGSSLEEVERRADELAVEMIADAVAEAMTTAEAPSATEQIDVFPLNTWPSSDERRLVDAALREGKGKELFDAWKLGTMDGEQYRLPVDFSAPGAPR